MNNITSVEMVGFFFQTYFFSLLKYTFIDNLGPFKDLQILVYSRNCLFFPSFNYQLLCWQRVTCDNKIALCTLPFFWTTTSTNPFPRSECSHILSFRSRFIHGHYKIFFARPLDNHLKADSSFVFQSITSNAECTYRFIYTTSMKGFLKVSFVRRIIAVFKVCRIDLSSLNQILSNTYLRFSNSKESYKMTAIKYSEFGHISMWCSGRYQTISKAFCNLAFSYENWDLKDWSFILLLSKFETCAGLILRSKHQLSMSLKHGLDWSRLSEEN